jgi:DNA-binding response OmpR family regulator
VLQLDGCANAAEETRMAKKAPEKISILVADDDVDILALVVGHVKGRASELHQASDGEEALKLARAKKPDLVVLDVMMPGMSGWEVCRKIREAVSLAHTGVIMLTGIGETLNEMTSPLYGADAHVDKPFEFAELDRRIAETLERRRAGALGRADGVLAEDGTVSFTKPIVKAKPSLAKTATKSAAPPQSKKAKLKKAKPKKAKPEKAKPEKAKPEKAKPKKAKPKKAKPKKAKPKKKPPAAKKSKKKSKKKR